MKSFKKWTVRVGFLSQQSFRRVLEQGDPDWTEGLRPELVLAYGGQSQKYIEGYTVRAMEDIENAIEAMPYGDDRSAMEMNYSTKSLQMNIDETGRIILSPLLIDKLGLTNEVSFCWNGQDISNVAS